MRLALLSLALLVPAFSSTFAGSPASADGPYQDQVVVGFEDDLPADLSRFLPPGSQELARSEALGWVAFRAPSGDAEAIRARLAAEPGVRYAVEPGIATPLGDTRRGEQWALPAMRWAEARAIEPGSHAVRVAVLDTGVDALHPDLTAHTTAGDPSCGEDRNFAEPGLPPFDDIGHGTHVAGIVAGATDNERGISGTAEVCVLNFKVMSNGMGPEWAVALALEEAAHQGARVASMSFHLGLVGTPTLGWPVVRQAVEYAASQGVLLVAAAGNDGCWEPDLVNAPARWPEVVAVAALEAPGTARAYFSSCGPDVEIAAPGATILSTVPEFVEVFLDGDEWCPPRQTCKDTRAEYPLRGTEAYDAWSGTSMAAPYVSGGAALAFSRNPALTAAGARCLLAATAVDLGPAGRDSDTGYGGLNLEALVLAAEDPASVGC
jgi:subtilisin family serine protease